MIFLKFCSIPGGGGGGEILNRDDLFHSVERKYCDVISLRVESQ